MISTKLRTLHHLQPLVRHEAIRTIRGRVTVPLKLVKTPMPKKQENKRVKEYKKNTIYHNRGIGHAVESHMTNRNISSFEEVDIDDVDHDTELGWEESKPVYEEHFREAMRLENRRAFAYTKKKILNEPMMPNMLTYAEKQEIKRLHKQDAEYWSVDRLAEGFPATPDIIKKILRSKFVAYSVDDIRKHDLRVQRHWHQFKHGHLNVSEELSEKYMKFINRQVTQLNEREMQKFIPPPPDFASQIPKKEFGSIITTSKAYKLMEAQKKKVETDEEGRMIWNASSNVEIKAIEGGSNLYDKHYTLDTFRGDIGRRDPDSVSELDKLILGQKNAVELPVYEDKDVSVEKPATDFLLECDSDMTRETGVADKHYKPDLEDSFVVDFPMRIDVPRKLWRKNKVYKVRDCFYDDGGYFLYRVPGLVD